MFCHAIAFLFAILLLSDINFIKAKKYRSRDDGKHHSFSRLRRYSGSSHSYPTSATLSDHIVRTDAYSGSPKYPSSGENHSYPSNGGIHSYPSGGVSYSYPSNGVIYSYTNDSDSRAYSNKGEIDSYQNIGGNNTFTNGSGSLTYLNSVRKHNYPSSGGSHSYPSSGGSHSYLSNGISHSYPSSGRNYSYPSSGGIYGGLPSSGGNYSNASSSGSHSYPSSGGSYNYPSSGGRHSYPSSGGCHNYPSSGESHSYPSSGGSHSYPSSGGSHSNPSSDISHSYPSSGGSNRGYPSRGGNYSYPSNGGIHSYPSGRGIHSYPSSGRAHIYPSSSGNHSYPSSGGSSICGIQSYKKNGSYPQIFTYPYYHGSDDRGRQDIGTTNIHNHYNYNPPQQIHYASPDGGPAVNYPVYRGSPPTYVYQYKDSGSKYGTLLAGLALFNLGALAGGAVGYSQVHSHSNNYKPQPNGVCLFGVKKDNGDFEETRIDCQLISSFIYAEHAKQNSQNSQDPTITVTTTVINTTVANTKNAQEMPLYILLKNGTLVPSIFDFSISNGRATAPDASVTVLTTTETSTPDVNALEVKGSPIEVTSGMLCYVKRKAPNSFTMNKKLPCGLLQTYADESLKSISAP